MNENGKSKDSLSSMNDLFGTNISKSNSKNKEAPKEESKFQDIQQLNNNIQEKTKEELKEPKEESINKDEQKEQQEVKEQNFKHSKFINDSYINSQDNGKSREEKPLVETLDTNDDNIDNSDGNLIKEMINTAKKFDFNKVKLNIATIGLIVNLLGSLFYNLIILIPGLIISYFAYQQAENNKLTKQDKLLAIIGMALGVIGLISLIFSYISKIMAII